MEWIALLTRIPDLKIDMGFFIALRHGLSQRNSWKKDTPMKKKIFLTALVTSTLSPVSALAEVSALPPLPAVLAYKSPVSGDAFTICVGSVGGAYFREGAEIAGMLEAYSQQRPNFPIRLVDVSPVQGGGTYGCMGMLARGEADAAIIQNDGRAVPATAELTLKLDRAGEILSEHFLTICSRENDAEDFGGVGEERDSIITVAGGVDSGTNVTLNLLASADGDFNLPTYRYETDFFKAVKEVADGDADCAVGVMAIDAPVLSEINDQFGDQVRLVGTWDRDFRDIQVRGEQVIGWRAIPEDTPGIDQLLTWDDNYGAWSPEVVTIPATVVYREGLDRALAQLLEEAVTENSVVLDDVEN